MFTPPVKSALPAEEVLLVDGGTVSVRALTERELDEIIARLAPRVGAILNRHCVVLDGIHIPPQNLSAAVAELIAAIVEIVPATLVCGCREPVAEEFARKLPAGLALMLFATIVEATIQRFGWPDITWKVAAAAGAHSALPEFLHPILRERVRVLEAAVAPQIEFLNRKARRRAKSRRH
jgi:hypothetical protein